MVVILTSRLISLSIEVCIPPEEVAIATKACGIDIINVRLFVCLSRCPKQQKTKTKDKYLYSCVRSSGLLARVTICTGFLGNGPIKKPLLTRAGGVRKN